MPLKNPAKISENKNNPVQNAFAVVRFAISFYLQAHFEKMKFAEAWKTKIFYNSAVARSLQLLFANRRQRKQPL
jgi:hypothetical protein